MIPVPFQRIGAANNAVVGREFEVMARRILARDLGLILVPNFGVSSGVAGVKKNRKKFKII